jgi:hypothetical protein
MKMYSESQPLPVQCRANHRADPGGTVSGVE